MRIYSILSYRSGKVGIKDSIEHGPHTQGARSSTAFGGWDHIFDPLPFLVGQVAWIYFFVHIPILHNPRRLFRQALTKLTVLRDTITDEGHRSKLTGLYEYLHRNRTYLAGFSDL